MNGKLSSCFVKEEKSTLKRKDQAGPMSQQLHKICFDALKPPKIFHLKTLITIEEFNICNHL